MGSLEKRVQEVQDDEVVRRKLVKMERFQIVSDLADVKKELGHIQAEEEGETNEGKSVKVSWDDTLCSRNGHGRECCTHS